MLLTIPVAIMGTIVALMGIIYYSFIESKQTVVPQNHPKLKIPQNFDKVVYCNSCQALIRESLKVLRVSKEQLEIEVALDVVCKTEFEGYPFVSSTLQNGCKVFLKVVYLYKTYQGWKNDLIKKLKYRSNNDKVEQEFCVEYTRACENIDPIELQLKKNKASGNQKYIIKGGIKMNTENISDIDLNKDQPLDDDI